MANCEDCDYKRWRSKDWCFIYPKKPSDEYRCPRYKPLPQPKYAHETS